MEATSELVVTNDAPRQEQRFGFHVNGGMCLRADVLEARP